MFIKKLAIKNLKCFQDKTLENIGVPNGGRGSGLNILIGENGTGKTTVLEAIDYLTLSSYSAENKIDIHDFNDFKQPIEIIAETDTYKCSSSIDFYKTWHFESSGIEFFAKSRDTKERNKLLSTSFDTHSSFKISSRYLGGKGEPKDVDSRDRSFNNYRIIDEGINIFYFDKNRNRQIATGNYKTTFERILDDLNWKFRKNLNAEKEAEIIKNVGGEFFKNIESIVGNSEISKTAEDFKTFFGNEDYANLKIDPLSLLQPFNNSFFALRKDSDLKQIIIKNLGSGVEIILTLLLLKNISGESIGKIIYLIDEPELHLHPKAQSKLLELLLEESKDKQIFISTHSPYMFKGSIGGGASLMLFKKEESGINIVNARDEGWGIFGRFSPTWGEINWFAYDLPTVEFHNELYGYLEANYKSILDDLTKPKKWFDDRKFEAGMTDGAIENLKEDVSVQTYIRHSIHHPENLYNEKYTEEELKKSTKEMVEKLRL